MTNPLLAWRHFFLETIWLPAPASRTKAYCYEYLQILLIASQALPAKGALIRTAGLAYASVLAIIPMLALLFAIFKGVGLQRVLAAHLLPQLAGGSQDFARQILTYVESTNVASLGVFGVIWLLVALMILMTNVEQAFNHIWQVSRARPWWRKLSDYLSIFLLFPILMAVALSVTTTLQSQPEIQNFIRYILPEAFFSAYRLFFSFGMVWLGFTFVYLVMPNTRVHIYSAFLGGLIAGTIWQGAQWLFHWFQASAPYYNAIYGALYQLLFLVIWMFWSWLIVLYGAEIAYTHQNLDRLRHRFQPQAEPLAGLDDEYLALAALVVIGERYHQGGPPLSLPELAQAFNEQEGLAAGCAEALQRCGLVLAVAPGDGAGTPRFLPSRPLAQLRVAATLACLRRERRQGVGRRLAGVDHISRLVQGLVEQPATLGGDLSVQDLVEQAQKPPGVPGAAG